VRLEWQRQDGSDGQVDLARRADAVTIGRSPEATVTLWHGSVTHPLHARVRREAGGWVVEDLGSTNGTFVRTRGARRSAPAAVRAGDVIEIGGHGIRVKGADGRRVEGSGTMVLGERAELTPAKRRVLRELARRPDGTRPTIQQVAAALHLAPATVKDHVDGLCDALNIAGGAGRLDRLVKEAERQSLT
jgi:pSer/pThr/pTyr-binding forkhead associated (FHA) protein